MAKTNQINQEDYQKIVREGQKIYEKIKSNYDPKYTGQFLAIDIDSSEVFLSNDGALAVEKAKEKYPEKVFYLIKIGYESAETVAQSLMLNH